MLKSYGKRVVCCTGLLTSSQAENKKLLLMNVTLASLMSLVESPGISTGPDFISLYINDLTDSIHNCVLMFADDTKLFSRIHRDNSAHDVTSMQHDIDSLVLWSKKWQLQFIVSKCKFLHQGRSIPNHTYQIGNQTIEQVTKERNLGVIIDNQMKSHQHVSLAANKAMHMIGKHSMLTNTFLSLYFTLISPHLEYSNVIWDHSTYWISKGLRMCRELLLDWSHLLNILLTNKQFRCSNDQYYRQQRANTICVYSLFNNIYNLDYSLFFT